MTLEDEIAVASAALNPDRRDKARERRLAKLLRAARPALAFATLLGLFERRVSGVYPIATSCINDRHAARAFYETALLGSDASSIRWALEFGITKVGLRGAMRILAQASEGKPQLPQYATYWLPMLLGADRAREAGEALSAAIAARGVARSR